MMDIISWKRTRLGVYYMIEKYNKIKNISKIILQCIFYITIIVVLIMTTFLLLGAENLVLPLIFTVLFSLLVMNFIFILYVYSDLKLMILAKD